MVDYHRMKLPALEVDYAIWPSLVVKHQDQNHVMSLAIFLLIFLFIPMARMSSAESPIICLTKYYTFRSYHQLLEDNTEEGSVLL